MMASRPVTALIADDEPLLRERLAAHLATLWPALQVVAHARNGREAVERFDEAPVDVVFLDVQMPGLNGVEAARSLRGRTHLVFVTAFEQYALQAFEEGAVDYLVKPFEPARLAQTVQRLQGLLASAAPPAAADAALDPLLDRLAEALRQRAGPRRALQWIRASAGTSVKLVNVDEVIYLKADEKYTLVVSGDGEALIRKPIRELADELDPERFVQIHRSVIVNLHCISHVVRGPNETADVHLRGRAEVLPVSRSYLHRFRQM